MKVIDFKETVHRGTDVRYYNETGNQIKPTSDLDKKEIIQLELCTGMLEDDPYISVTIKTK